MAKVDKEPPSRAKDEQGMRDGDGLGIKIKFQVGSAQTAVMPEPAVFHPALYSNDISTDR